MIGDVTQKLSRNQKKTNLLNCLCLENRRSFGSIVIDKTKGESRAYWHILDSVVTESVFECQIVKAIYYRRMKIKNINVI